MACNDIVSNNEKYLIVHVASTSTDNWFITFTYISSRAANTAATSNVYLLYSTPIARKDRCERQSEKKATKNTVENAQRPKTFFLSVIVLSFWSSPPRPLLVQVSLLICFWPLFLCTFRFLCVCRARHAINLAPALFICLKLYLWKRDRMRLFCAENITKVDSTCVLMRIYTLFDAIHQTCQRVNNVKCDDDGTYASGGYTVRCTPVCELQLHILNL